MPTISRQADARRERRITRALFAAGLTTFASMYSAQALLPSLSAAFGASPAHAALAVSLTTGVVAVVLVPVSALSMRYGRARVMVVSAVASSVLGLLVPLSPTLGVLLVARAAQGLALAGVPAVAMAYLAAEIGTGGLAAAMGIYVAGTTVGGMIGRLVPSITLEWESWRWAAATVGAVAAGCALWFVKALPPSRPDGGGTLRLGALARDIAEHLSRPVLPVLFAVAFLLAGAFVSVYNFVGYRLVQAPFELSPTVTGFVFLLYLAGTVASSAAGRLVERAGRPAALALSVLTVGVGLALTLPDRLPVVLAGILLFTAGFFAAHAIASAWVGAAAAGNRDAATWLYLLSYYLGGSVSGWAAGLAYGWDRWSGLAAYVGALVVLAAVATATLTVAARTSARSAR